MTFSTLCVEEQTRPEVHLLQASPRVARAPEDLLAASSLSGQVAPCCACTHRLCEAGASGLGAQEVSGEAQLGQMLALPHIHPVPRPSAERSIPARMFWGRGWTGAGEGGYQTGWWGH